jgi:enamine deaminase RidA (YjgF/YER057c/UK114 family)
MSEVLQPAGWAKPKGYSNGVAASGRMVFVAGQVGWDPTSEAPKFPASFAEQFDRCLGNVVAVLTAGDAKPEHLVRLTMYVSDKKEYLANLKACGAAWKKHIGRTYPAMACLEVKGFVEEGAKLEIEATAVVP